MPVLCKVDTRKRTGGREEVDRGLLGAAAPGEGINETALEIALPLYMLLVMGMGMHLIRARCFRVRVNPRGARPRRVCRPVGAPPGVIPGREVARVEFFAHGGATGACVLAHTMSTPGRFEHCVVVSATCARSCCSQAQGQGDPHLPQELPRSLQCTA